jgi:hypothetical protein
MKKGGGDGGERRKGKGKGSEGEINSGITIEISEEVSVHKQFLSLPRTAKKQKP